MAVKDRISHRVIQVAATSVRDLHRIAGPGDNRLAVQVLAVIAIGGVEPLVRMLVVNVGDTLAGVQHAKLHVIAHITVVDV